MILDTPRLPNDDLADAAFGSPELDLVVGICPLMMLASQDSRLLGCQTVGGLRDWIEETLRR